MNRILLGLALFYFLLELVRALIVDSLPALRLFPFLAGRTTVFLTGLIARRMGAGQIMEMVSRARIS